MINLWDFVEFLVVLFALGIQVLWRFVVRPLWDRYSRQPLMRGDFVVSPPRNDIVFEVLSYPRPGFVAIRQRGLYEGRRHPIIVVDPVWLRRVRKANK